MGSHWAAHMGGAQYQVKCLLDALTRRSDVEIYYLAHRTPQQLRQDGYEIVRIGSRWRGVGRSLIGPGRSTRLSSNYGRRLSISAA